MQDLQVLTEVNEFYNKKRHLVKSILKQQVTTCYTRLDNVIFRHTTDFNIENTQYCSDWNKIVQITNL